MAGYLEGVSNLAHLFLSKRFPEILLISTAIFLNIWPAYAQPAYFLSIDCGGQANFTENGLDWITDNGTYMTTGNSVEQPSVPGAMGENKALLSYRRFPEGRNKYCYELHIPDLSFGYLLRLGFFMNNTTLSLARPFLFIVSVDATDWFTVSNDDQSEGYEMFFVQEGIFNPPRSVLNICFQPVVGEAFISSLELRQFNDTNLYSYPGGSSQYLSLLYRNNFGTAYPPTPDVRYPDDPYDRIWASPTSLYFPNFSSPVPPDNNLRADAWYVPPKVMKDALLFPSNPQSAGGLFIQFYSAGPQLYVTPGDSFYLVVYAENLNTSVSQPYNMSITLQLNPLDPTSNNFSAPLDPSLSVSSQAICKAYPYNILESNYVVLGTSSDSTLGLESLPVNAIEMFTQHSYNFSTTNSDDDAIITNLKTGFALTDWQGDPCLPVPHDWLSCNLNNPPFGSLSAPCVFNRTTVNTCNGPRVDLHSKYYVTSLNISNRPASGFSDIINAGSPNALQLGNLLEMSITNCGMDDRIFQFLLYNYTNSSELTILNMSYNAITSFPLLGPNLPSKLTILDLSHNKLQGEISSLDIWVEANKASLQEVNVSNNNLSGTFSSDLYFSSLPNLTIAIFDNNSIQGVLNLSRWYDALQEANKNLNSSNVTLQLFSFLDNNISSIAPSANELGSTLTSLINSPKSSFQKKGILLGGNPYCKSPKTYIQHYLCRFAVDEHVSDDDNKVNWEILIPSIIGGVIALLLLCATFVTLWKLWKQVYTLREVQRALADRKVLPPFYHYSDLKLATRDFNQDNKLGHGGFGIVYKGILGDETTLAVKKLFNSRRVQVIDEFLSEVLLITGIKHRNLVQLKGCCIKDTQRFLVYEYVEKGNLAEALWGSKAHGSLNWQQRFQICVGVARGLSYLHEELQPSIIHRSIKPENILLDENFNPKIADFGVASHNSNEASQAHFTQIAGTLGYFAPEYATQGQISDKIDVYSYGVLILEVVSGRKCINMSKSYEEKFLKDWVRFLYKKGALFDILESKLRKKCDELEVIRAIKIGLLCVQHRPEMRPSMSQVVAMFLGSMDIEVMPEKFDNTHPRPSRLLNTIERIAEEYPRLQIVLEDSSVIPLLDLDSQSPSTIPLADQVQEL